MAKRMNTAGNKGAAKKKNSLPIVAMVAVIACATAVFTLGVNKSDKTSTNENVQLAAASEADAPAERKISGAVTVEKGDSLIIPTSGITSDASFFPVEVNGTAMEVIAVKDSKGNIRTAFNTCQVCYGSSRAYYEQSGDYLVCQNCGNRFSMDQVEIESGGCNPWPIFDSDKTVTDDEISISYDFLTKSQGIFANWKSTY